MLKKAVKTFGLILILTASIGSFIFINSDQAAMVISSGVSFEQVDVIPDDHTVSTPAITIAKKAIIVAKCFLYPTE